MQSDATKIAIVGIGCWYPGAADPQRLWENVLSKRRQFRTMPDVRMPPAEYHDADRSVPDKTYAAMAAVLDGFEFDWSKHRIPKGAYEATDLAHWLALEVALQMLKDAGYTAETLPSETTRVIVGNTLTGEVTRSNTLRLRWPYVQKTLLRSAAELGLAPQTMTRLVQTMERDFKEPFPPVTEDSLAGGLANTIAGRICNYLNLNGGGYTVDGACSSSLIAVYSGATQLAQRATDFVIAGGVDISLDPFELLGFAKTGALTPTEMSVYDKRGNGFIPGEGCGFVGMKRLEDARRDGDKVYAVLDGWGMSSDGKGGITAPSVVGQSLALRRAYQRAGVGAGELDFIEGHGTGTAVGDRTELLGIAKALASLGPSAKRSCGVTSFKSVVGHTKAAAGIGAFIKAVIAVNQRVVPPTAGCTRPHDVFSAEASALYPVLRGAILPPERTVRAGVSAMGFGGINLHVTIASGDAPLPTLRPRAGERAALASAQDTEVFCLSAGSWQSLLAAIHELGEEVRGASLAELTDLAADVARRCDAQALFRASVVASSPQDLSEKLGRLEASVRDDRPRAEGVQIEPQHLFAFGSGHRRARIGFVFPGQGSQQINMARALVERFEWARTLVADADRWAAELGTSDLARSIYPDADRLIEASELDSATDRLRDTRLAQPAIVLASLIWLKYLERLGIEAQGVLGHSLGELPAFHAAGAFDERTLLRLATLRGQLMAGSDAKAEGAMLSLTCDRARAESAMAEVDVKGGVLVIANLNSSSQTVVSGDARSVGALREVCQRHGVRAQPLRVSNAFHSPLVAGAAERIADLPVLPTAAARLDKRLISSCDGQPVSPRVNLRQHFSWQIVTPVDFVAAVASLRADVDWTVEVGPGRVLSSLMDREDGLARPALPVESSAESFRDLDWLIALSHANGVSIRWDALYAERVVEPFRRARELRFIVNPCERTPSVAFEKVALEPVAKEAPTLSAGTPPPVRNETKQSPRALAVLEQQTALLTGFASSSIRPELRPLDDLNLDSIKVASLIGETCLALGIEVPENPAALASLSLEEIALRLVAPGRDAEAASTRAASATVAVRAEEMLLDLAARYTGFDRGTLDANASLTDDLNLDSIKITALLSEAQALLSLDAGLDPAGVRDATIREIAQRFEALRARPGVAEQPSAPRPEPTAGASPRAADTEAFAMRLFPTPLPRNEPWAQAGRAVAIQCDADERPIALSLAKRLEASNATVVILDAAELSLTPRTDFNRLIVILPRCVSSSSGEAALVASSVRRLRAAAVASTRQRECNGIIYVQFGGLGHPMEGSSSSFSNACTSAFAASMHLERSGLRVRVLDLHPRHGAEFTASRILEEQSGDGGYVLCHYDELQRRHEQRAVALDPEGAPRRGIEWSSRDVVLVTGGAKGISAECALAFAGATQVRMILVGSSPAPALDSSSESGRTLNRFKAAGLFARYYQCDVTDRAALAELVLHVAREYGPVTGVIHGAGLNRPRRVEQVDEASAISEVSPKLAGLLNLCEILRSAPPKLFAGMSSIIGVTGMPGNAWYAFSNEAASACLARFKAFHPDTAIVSLAYGAWSEVGMAAKMGSDKHLAKLGVVSLAPETGVAHFLKATLRRLPTLELVVTGALGSLDTWRREAGPEEVTCRFLENVVRFERGVEVVAKTHLTLDDDLYLKDHFFRGIYLFPTVFGLEAMAQAVAKVAGVRQFESLKLVDVGLTRPIIVSSERGAEIQVTARVVGRDDGGRVRRVQVGVAVDQTGFKRDHFSATFVLEPQAPPASARLGRDAQGQALDLDPQRDLYGVFLFQGPMFRRLARIWKMDTQGSLSGARVAEHAAHFSAKHAQTLLLGDPLFRDALLQTAQLSDSLTVLPIGVDEWCLYDLKPPSDERCLVRSDVIERSEAGPTCHVLAETPAGLPIERLGGYRLKRMDPSDLVVPDLDDWVNPTRRDAGILRELLARHCETFGVRPPDCSLTFVPHLSRLSSSERRLLEAPLLIAVGKSARGSHGSAALEVAWREDGKPLFAGIPSDELDAGLAHDGGHCLCVAGPGRQGCDLEGVASRTREEWLRLLGAEHAALLAELSAAGESLDEAGTRLWCAREALIKAQGSGSLARFEKRDEAVLFFATSAGTAARILTFGVSLTRPPRRVIALALPAGPVGRASVRSDIAVRRSSRDDAEAGARPGQAPGLVHRFRTTFNDTVGTRGGVKPATFADWMGTLRERSIASVAEELIRDFASGRWGMVTNYSNVQVFRNVTCLEELEGRLRFMRTYGKFGSSIDLLFDWSRVQPDGSLESVARADMGTTWVEIVGHGVVEVRPFPAYLDELVRSYLPPGAAPETREPEPLTPEPGELGAVLYAAPNAPRVEPELARQTFLTTTVESNLVGNVYYANYYRWQNELLERFLHSMHAGTNGALETGALSCTFSSVAHLREAMPFDRIEVVMALRGLYERGMQIHFDFYKANEGSRPMKLATGEVQAHWVDARSRAIAGLPRALVGELTQFLSVAAE